MATTASTRTNDKDSVKPMGGTQGAQATHTDAVLHGETASSELVGRLATLSNQHLRDVTALPNAAVSHFNKELAKTPTPRKRTRK
jgi:hypothetical protein